MELLKLLLKLFEDLFVKQITNMSENSANFVGSENLMRRLDWAEVIKKFIQFFGN